MNAITVRNLPPEVARAIRAKAKREHLSLNKAVVSLLEAATGAVKPKEPMRHDDLDHLAGAWSQEEYEEFMESLREQRKIEPEMWK